MSPTSSPPRAPEDSKDFALRLTSSDGSSETTLAEPTRQSPNSHRIPQLPQLRSVSDNQPPPFMSPSSTPLGMLNNARRPAAAPSLSSRGGGGLPQDMQAKMKAFHASRQGTPPNSRSQSIPAVSSGGLDSAPLALSPVGPPGNPRLPQLRPQIQGFSTTPQVSKSAKPSLSARRNMKLPGGLPGSTPNLKTDDIPQRNGTATQNPASGGSLFNKFSEYVDTKNGVLKFAGKAVIHGQGIDFSSGSNFNISLDEVDTLDELGKGNYGTVYKVRHARPRIRRPGTGLGGNRSSASPISPEKENDSTESSPITKPGGETSGIVMAMKEIRLELDEAKFAAIIMELDILHRCISPYIIDFYGAFFQEGAVYICIEFMDGGSIDKIYGDGIPENVLRKITYATARGLKELKDVHNIIHRDVKPTNILVNTRGQVKICDFGVSGNLVASIAKTNIGCQSYMAPERISGGGIAQAGANASGGTYSVQSDIWSLGLTIIECAMGRYPYPPETYNNIFSQLSAIVDGDPPDLPAEGYSPLARDFVRGCLNKVPKKRPTYSMLLNHGWLAPLSKPDTISEEDEMLEENLGSLNLEGHGLVVNGSSENAFDKEVSEWAISAIERKRQGKMGFSNKPPLHTVSLNAEISPAS